MYKIKDPHCGGPSAKPLELSSSRSCHGRNDTLRGVQHLEKNQVPVHADFLQRSGSFDQLTVPLSGDVPIR